MNTKIFAAMSIATAALIVACAPANARTSYSYTSQNDYTASNPTTPPRQSTNANTRAQPSNQVLRFSSKANNKVTLETKGCIRKDANGEEVTCLINILNTDQVDISIRLVVSQAILEDGSEFISKDYKFRNYDWSDRDEWYVIRPEIVTPLVVKFQMPTKYTTISYLDISGPYYGFFGRFSLVPISTGMTSAQAPTEPTSAPNTTPTSQNSEQLYVPADSEDCVQIQRPIAPGEKITIEATGFATYGTQGGFSSIPKVNPNGDRWEGNTRRDKKMDRDARFPNEPVGALVGFIDSEDKALFLGSVLRGTVQRGGDFFLCFNDVPGQYSDNTGGYTVKISH